MQPTNQQLPTPAEQQATYQSAKAQLDREYQAWKDGGRQGPPPPRPVPPHTPGWAPLPAAAPPLPRVTESGEFPPPAVPKLALGATSLVEAYDRMQARIYELEGQLTGLLDPSCASPDELRRLVRDSERRHLSSGLRVYALATALDAVRAGAAPAQDADGTPSVDDALAAITRAEEMVRALCLPRDAPGRRGWLMSIPAEPDSDPDLVIGHALHLARQTLAAQARAAEARAAEALDERIGLAEKALRPFAGSEAELNRGLLPLVQAVVQECTDLRARLAEAERERDAHVAERVKIERERAEWCRERENWRHAHQRACDARDQADARTREAEGRAAAAVEKWEALRLATCKALARVGEWAPEKVTNAALGFGHEGTDAGMALADLRRAAGVVAHRDAQGFVQFIGEAAAPEGGRDA